MIGYLDIPVWVIGFSMCDSLGVFLLSMLYCVTAIIYSLLSRKDRLSPIHFMSNKGTTEQSLLFTWYLLCTFSGMICVTDIAFYVLQKLTDFLAKQNHYLLQSVREYS